jgi:2-polyprenyl-6-methoxyphenol hydroxylase-like FAD-dependent oxidoreductase
MPNKYDVLVVGAGPTGPIVTNELLRRGVDFRWIEKRKSPLSTTHAL